MQLVTALRANVISDFVMSNPKRPIEEAMVRIKIVHLLPQYQAGLLEDIFNITGIDQLFGDKRQNLMTVPQEQQNELLLIVIQVAFMSFDCWTCCRRIL